MPSKRSNKKVKSRMLSVPESLHHAAMKLLARLRVGLDIPSRAEVLDLAARIEAISAQMGRLEATRLRDSEIVEELRHVSKASQTSTRPKAPSQSDQKKPSSKKSKTTSTSGSAPGKVKSDETASSDAPTPSRKRKPRTRKRPSNENDK